MSTENKNIEFDDGKLKYESPLLSKLKQSPIDFKEPDGYFEDFNRRLNEKIKYQQPSITPLKKQGVVRRLLQPRYAIAAALITAICVIGFKFIKEGKPLTQNDIAEVVSTEKIESIDEEVLIDAIEIETLDETEMLNEEEISDELIIDYLVENDIDLDLINEL
ncbi:MAG: hypothetical protein AB7G44_08625 [Bacteroidia bacterium]